MLIDQINLNHLRVFTAVYSARSMTRAAQELHLTQSGISQHIRALEDSIGIKLFDRFKQRIVPTAEAEKLFDQCALGLSRLEEILLELTGRHQEMRGAVRVGMPTEFGNNLLLPIISQFLKQHELVQVEISVGLVSEISAQLLRGDIDFAYVDTFSTERQIKVEGVFDEVHELCASTAYLKSKGGYQHKKAFYESLDYIGYLPGEPVLRNWFKYHLRGTPPALNVRAYVSSAQSVLRFITGDLGVGVLPHHIIEQLGRAGSKIVRLEGNGKELKETINVAYLAGRTQSEAAIALKDYVSVALKDKESN